MDEVRADYVELSRLAQTVLDAADAITDGLATARESLSIPSQAIGNTSAGPSVHSAHESLSEQGATATERVVEVLEGDSDRLYGVAFAYQKADQESANCIHRLPNGKPIPC